MYPVVLFIIFLFISLPIVLYMTISTYKNHQKFSKGVVNYDPFMRKFIFKIYKTKEETLTILSKQKKSDSFSCTINKEENSITFYEYQADARYRFNIQEFDSYCILRLKQLSFAAYGAIIYSINPFMIKMLDAEIIPYFEQGFDF